MERLTLSYAGPFNFAQGPPKGGLPVLHLNPYSWSKVSIYSCGKISIFFTNFNLNNFLAIIIIINQIFRFPTLFTWILLLVLAFLTLKTKANIKLGTYKLLLIHTPFSSR